MSNRPLRVAICAADEAGFERIEDFLLSGLRPERRRESQSFLLRDREPAGRVYDVVIYDEDVYPPPRAVVFRADHTDQMIQRALELHEDLGVALARAFPPFRRRYIDTVIANTCTENTLFSIATALPDVIPSLIELPWAVAEFASDTAFLTMNQMKMAFLIAAASDREVGYRKQRSEIATVIASAFGWRALARQLIGKVPFGGGLIAKAAVAYAGTRVVGLSLNHYYRIGYTYTREEREHLYADALNQGKKMAARMLARLRPDLAAKFAGETAANEANPPSASKKAK